jgi:D-alanyl-D-alanine carboxypeptidase
MKGVNLEENDLLGITDSPGAQYMLLNGESILLECNAGVADIITREPVDAATTFNNFSVTKTATAAAILLLAEQGKLKLTDLVNPWFEAYPFAYPFTVQQLVAHQAGFTDPVPISWIHLPAEEVTFDEKKFIHKLLLNKAKQRFIPGTKFRYSSVGYLLLSLIIEKMSGQSYAEFVHEHILQPCGSAGSLGFSIADEKHHATGYHPRYSFSNLLLSFFLDRRKYIQYNHGSWTAFRNFYVNGKAYGGFIGNATGLAAYLQALLKDSLFQHPETQQLMFTEQNGGMALGWFTGQLKGNRYVCHAGGGGGYYCEIRIYPDLKTASVLVRNKSGFSDQRVLDRIDHRFLHAILS